MQPNNLKKKNKKGRGRETSLEGARIRKALLEHVKEPVRRAWWRWTDGKYKRQEKTGEARSLRRWEAADLKAQGRFSLTKRRVSSPLRKEAGEDGGWKNSSLTVWVFPVRGRRKVISRDRGEGPVEIWRKGK